MLKKTVAAFIAACLVLLVGCRGDKPNESVSSEPTAQETSSAQTSEVIQEETSTPEEVSEPITPEQQQPKQPKSSGCPEGLDPAGYQWLMSLDNTRKGHGWLHSENRQSSYFDQFGALTTADRSQPTVYLTFDEGYENGYTPIILDTLAAKGVHAVFFVTMDYVRKEPALVARMIHEGHTVGNHSTTHPSFPSLSIQAAYDEVQQLHNYVQSYFGYTMHLFRFPSGDHSDRMLATVQSLGYTSVFWNFAHADWDPANQPTHDETLSRILQNTQNGTIYLLHGVSESDTAVLGQAIDEIRARGYSFGLLK